MWLMSVEVASDSHCECCTGEGSFYPNKIKAASRLLIFSLITCSPPSEVPVILRGTRAIGMRVERNVLIQYWFYHTNEMSLLPSMNPQESTCNHHCKTANGIKRLAMISECLNFYRIVICFLMSPPLPVTPPSLEETDVVPGFFSKIFQNFKLSSAAAVASI